MLFVQQTMYALGEEEDEDEEADEEDGAAGYKYADFFVDEKSNHNKKKKAGVVQKDKRQPRQSISDGASDDEDDGDDDDENDDDFDDSNVRDDYESSDDGKHVPSESRSKAKGSQQRSRLSSQISDLEKDLLAAKPWELRGEVRAADRPENSFLSLTADIERYVSYISIQIIYRLIDRSINHLCAI